MGIAHNEQGLALLGYLKNGRVGKGISAQASHKTVHEILTSHGFSYSV